MELELLQILSWLLLICPIMSTRMLSQVHTENLDLDFDKSSDNFNQKFLKSDSDEACIDVHPNSRDIGKRFYAILPYFDKEHRNTEFLNKFRATVSYMGQGEDMLDREAAFYAAALIPVIFMQRYRDTWCLMQRFHRALRLYQISHPTEKRASLKLLQNYRAVNHKIRMFIVNLPKISPGIRLHTHNPIEVDDEELPDKRDISVLKELVRNLG